MYKDTRCYLCIMCNKKDKNTYQSTIFGNTSQNPDFNMGLAVSAND